MITKKITKSSIAKTSKNPENFGKKKKTAWNFTTVFWQFSKNVMSAIVKTVWIDLIDFCLDQPLLVDKFGPEVEGTRKFLI